MDLAVETSVTDSHFSLLPLTDYITVGIIFGWLGSTFHAWGKRDILAGHIVQWYINNAQIETIQKQTKKTTRNNTIEPMILTGMYRVHLEIFQHIIWCSKNENRNTAIHYALYYFFFSDFLYRFVSSLASSKTK